MLKFGTVVKNKKTGLYGTLEYSSFGYSVHTYETYNGQIVLGKTLAMNENEILKHYDIVELPEGLCIGEYGGVLEL